MSNDQCNGQSEKRGYEDEGHSLRTQIKAVAFNVKRYMSESKSATIPDGVERGEMIANATLAYRHLEDAAMRIGKAMQAYQGGISILDIMRDKELKDREISSTKEALNHPDNEAWEDVDAG